MCVIVASGVCQHLEKTKNENGLQKCWHNFVSNCCQSVANMLSCVFSFTRMFEWVDNLLTKCNQKMVRTIKRSKQHRQKFEKNWQACYMASNGFNFTKVNSLLCCQKFLNLLSKRVTTCHQKFVNMLSKCWQKIIVANDDRIMTKKTPVLSKCCQSSLEMLSK